MKHFCTHQGYNACNKNRKDNMTTDWAKVKCESCKRNDQYKQAKQDNPIERSACGRTLDEFLKACNDDCSNVDVFRYRSIPKHKTWSTWEGNGTAIGQTKKELLEHCIRRFGLKIYRIKSIPSIAKQQADGWNGKTIKEVEFKPKQYTITEDEMNDISGIIQDGRHCNMDFTDDFNEMKDNAFAIKDKALLYLENIINEIKGDLDEKF